ncbi:glutamine synthetase family protein [Chakrabartyella piscis]|uniref:glutamine synthetase family protein n=1 Tax=Chakrabartyella piscis TaxID=2918914 RepID=UPI0029587036|nr:glutamine synthetase family protein [Chakrabartyella piscis]
MKYTVEEVMEFVEENDVKFIRLAFCDIFGTQKNISIMPAELLRAFTDGISFDASSISGFMNVEESDLFLIPDPDTMSILPWRPAQGRVIRLFCTIKNPDGSDFAGDGRTILKKTIAKAKNMGYQCKVGTEGEFYLFELDEKGLPTKAPVDAAGYCDIAPLDRGETVRREICLMLEEMGMIPESSHHETGAGQNEVDFKYSNALRSADNFVTFKSVVKSVANANGMYASFMPKPLKNEPGSGLHINLSLFQNGENIFRIGDEKTKEGERFVAGIMHHIEEITVFLNATTNSYGRFGNHEAPQYITWSHGNRSQLIRIPSAKGEYARMELRSPDSTCNLYLALTLIIEAGLEGIREKMELSKSVDLNLLDANVEIPENLKTLPLNMKDAIEVAENSPFVLGVLPPKTVEKYMELQKKIWNQYEAASNPMEFEDKQYFGYL